MFVYCGNNPVMRVDCSGRLWKLIFVIIFVGITCTSSQNMAPYYTQKAQEKYNSGNVAVYEENTPPVQKGDINAEIYHISDSMSNIKIDNSLNITSGYEQEAILDVIIESPYYSEEAYGNRAFMRAQWVAHNACYDIASSGKVGFWLMQRLSGSENPIQSSHFLDIRNTNNLLKRQQLIYTIISWFCY